MEKFDQLIQIMQRLRSPEDGCSWDIKQNHKTLAKYVIEEAYEVLDAIENGSPDDLKEELGDLLLQVVFHAQMASEKNAFGIEQVIDGINQKMIDRHPHVFANKRKLTPEEVETQWEEIKHKQQSTKLLQRVPSSYPALMKSFEYGEKASRVGFEWNHISQVKEKMDEEWEELMQAISDEHNAHVEEELGDFLFTVAQYARKLGYNPEIVLQKANAKFLQRIHAVEERVQNVGRKMSDCTTEELTQHWTQIKKKTRGTSRR